jgi:uncharacterized protein
MEKQRIRMGVIILLLLLFACKEPLKEKGSQKYISEINAWHKKRIENLKKENGWLNLAGLYWLKDGENSFGSSKENDIIFPKGKCPDVMGKFILKDSVVTIIINNGTKVLCDKKEITKKELIVDSQGEPSVLEYGSLRWFVIKRGNKYGIRVRDLEADLVKNFGDIETFPINSDWKLEALFKYYKPPKIIAVPNVLGTTEEEKSPGALYFTKDNIEYKLDVLDDGDSYFIVFADETSGDETYGGGRFISVPKADRIGNTYIDFNKAYNQPCSFTKYATCPMPPQQNYLKIKILAGEKYYGHGNH